MIDQIQTQMALAQVKTFFNNMKELGYTEDKILALVKKAMEEGNNDGTITSD